MRSRAHRPVRARTAIAALALAGAAAHAAPPNDLCSNAQFVPLPGPGTYTVTGTTAAATSDLPTSGCPDADSDVNDVWYRFVAPVSGFYRLSTAGSQIDTTLSLWTGACADLYVGGDLACNNDADPVFDFSSLIVISINAGTEVRARVAGQYAIDGPIVFSITVPAGTPATGACCTGTTCAAAGQGVCAGTFQGAGTACATSPCPASGLCCRGSACLSGLTQARCTPTGLAGAVFVASGACGVGATAPCCKADYNKVGGIELLDIFTYLTDWFAGSPATDFDGQNGADILDIFAFLTAWFAGGC
jgi:hypothetical protein